MIRFTDENITIKDNLNGEGFDLSFNSDKFKSLFEAVSYACKYFDMTSWKDKNIETNIIDS